MRMLTGLSRTRFGEFARQPGPGQFPVAHHALRRILRAAAVSSTLNPPKKRSSMTRAFRGWNFDNASRASSTAIRSRSRTDDTSAISSRLTSDECSTRSACPPRLDCGARPRRVDEDTPHHPRRNRKEMHTALPSPLRRHSPESKVHLIDECRGLQRIACLFPSHVPARHAVQLFVDFGSQTVQSSLIAFAPRLQ